MSDGIQPGDVVSCPQCGKELLRCLQIPEVGSCSYPECFEDIGWGGKVGAHSICPVDHARWCVMSPFRIHVQNRGWLTK